MQIGLRRLQMNGKHWPNNLVNWPSSRSSKILERAIEINLILMVSGAAEARLICRAHSSLEWLKQVSSEDKREPLNELFGDLMAVGQAAKAQKLLIQKQSSVKTTHWEGTAWLSTANVEIKTPELSHSKGWWAGSEGLPALACSKLGSTPYRSRNEGCD